jgi:hypothetical protein
MNMIIAILAAFVCAVAAQSVLNLPVTQDFSIANNGYGGAQVTRPDLLSFFNNRFQSSVSFFGIDLSPLAVIDRTTINSAVIKFNNFTLRGDSATVALTLLNYGQVFEEGAVSLNTQPTSQGSMGSATFATDGSTATVDVTSKIVNAFNAGGLFGFRVDPPGGPVSVASHRVDDDSVVMQVTYGGSTTSTAAPTSAPTTSSSAPSTAAPTSQPAPATTTARPAPSTSNPAPSSSTTTTTRAPGTPSSSANPTAGPTSSLSPGSTGSLTTKAPATTDAPRSDSGTVRFEGAWLLCLVPLILML